MNKYNTSLQRSEKNYFFDYNDLSLHLYYIRFNNPLSFILFKLFIYINMLYYTKIVTTICNL